MKKMVKRIIPALLASVVLLLLMPSVKIWAAEKSADEQQLEALTAYLNALTAQGASQEDIDFAKACVAVVQNRIAAGTQTAANASIPDATANAVAVTREQLEAAANAQVKELAKSVTQPPVVAGLIFVGDSRTVEMHNLMGETGVTYIAENSKGYNWFVENAIPRIDSCAGKGSRIVINLGVNDLGNIDKYIALVNQKAIEWRAKGAKVYYATVNPVWENPYASEDKVIYFNNRLKTGLIGVNMIDTHDFLVANGYKLRDGLHFDGPTTLSIYNYILGSLK